MTEAINIISVKIAALEEERKNNGYDLKRCQRKERELLERINALYGALLKLKK